MTFDIPRRLHVGHIHTSAQPRVTILLLHGIGNAAASWQHVERALPADTRVVALDLLGFGQSPKPMRASYNVRVQARSVMRTLLSMGLYHNVILVGHSMGALISIDIARRYPWLVRGLVLCSPPIYRTARQKKRRLVNAEALLTRAYTSTAADAAKKPKLYIQLAKITKATGLTSPAFQVDSSTIHPYITALKASIVNQTAWRDIQRLHKPTHIIYSQFDPFVVNKNIIQLAHQPHITAQKVLALHEVTGPYIQPIRQAVDRLIA